MSSTIEVGSGPSDDGPPDRGGLSPKARRYLKHKREREERQAQHFARAIQHVPLLEAQLASETRTRLLRYDTCVRLLLTAAGGASRPFQPDGCPPVLGAEDCDAASEVLATTEIATMVAGWAEMTRHQAERDLNDALTLQGRLPRVLRKAWDGGLFEQHLDVVLRATTGLETEQLARLDEHAAGLGETQLPSFRRRVNAFAARLRQETQPDVAKTIQEQRTVSIKACHDGSAALWVNGPAPEVYALHARLSAVARQARRDSSGTELDPRTLTQLRFDLLTDAVIDGNGPGHLPAQAQVAVTVPLLTAMGIADLPGELDGFGPLDADTAREIAAGVPTWTRLLTDPADGQILPVSHQYRIPVALRDHVRARNQWCTAPGCTTRATLCETDHIIPFDFTGEGGGLTEVENLHPLCTYHHQAKTEGRLHVERTRDARGDPVLRWTLPGSTDSLDVVDDPDTAHAEQVRILVDHQRRQSKDGPAGAGRPSTSDPPPF